MSSIIPPESVPRRRSSQLIEENGLNLKWSAIYAVSMGIMYFVLLTGWDTFFIKVCKERKYYYIIVVTAILLYTIITNYILLNHGPNSKTVIIHLLLLFLSTCTNGISSAYCSYLHKPNKTLFDIGFWLFPEISRDSWFFYVGDIMDVFLVFSLITIFVFLSPESRLNFFCSCIRLTALVYYFRTITTFWTSLPGPAIHCRIGSTELPVTSSIYDILGHISPLYGMSHNCGDLIFSGHTAGAYVWLYCFTMALPKKFRFIGWIITIVYLSILIPNLLCCRRHYSIDIVMGLFIGVFTSYLFHDSWLPRGWIRDNNGYRKVATEAEVV